MAFFKKAKEKYVAWQKDAPVRREKMLAAEKQRVAILKERATKEEYLARIRKQRQVHRQSFSLGPAFSMQPSSATQSSYFGAKPPVVQAKPKRKTKRKKRKTRGVPVVYLNR